MVSTTHLNTNTSNSKVSTKNNFKKGSVKPSSIYKNQVPLVPITPVEYDKGRYRRWYFKGERWLKNITAEEFREILTKANVKNDPSVITNPNKLILYQYPNKPLLVINNEDGRIYTTQGTIDHYEMKFIRHQASILIRILHKFGYTLKAKRGKSVSRIRIRQGKEAAESLRLYYARKWRRK